MSGAGLQVEEAARGDLGGIVKGSAAAGGSEKKPVLDINLDLPSPSDTPDVLTGPNGEIYPTREELETLPRVHGHTSWVLYTIGFIELCERFAYYGTTVLYTNFVSYKLPTNEDAPFPRAGAGGTNGQSGALGLGQQTSTGLSLFSQFFSYIMPLLGGYIADQYLGKFKTISVAIVFALVGHVLIIVAALPDVIATGKTALAPYILGLLLFGVGVGFFKTNISPLIAEQYEHENPRPTIKILKNGDRVVVDPFLTIARIFVRYYFLINVGVMLGQISMVYAEKYVGFWLAYTLPTLLLLVCPIVMFVCRKRYVGRHPTGSVLGNAFKLIGFAIKHRKEGPGGKFSWDVAKPSKLGADKPTWMTFDDEWVDQVRRGLKACYVFAFLPIYWLPYSQISNNLTNQAATMRLDGTPNDIVQNLDPIVLIIFIPIMDQLVYPYIAKKGWNFTPIKKMFLGFMFGTGAMICAAVTQYYIYKMSPCGYNASDQDCIAELGPPDISVWVQALTYAFVAFSEIFTSVVGLEYAFTKAPKNMRSFITGIFWFSNAFSSAIGQAFVPLAADPHITWLYGSIGIIAFVGGIAFWFTFRGLDQEEARLNVLPESTYEGRKNSVVDIEQRMMEQEKGQKLRRIQGLD